jgi:hypothetical protein
LRPCARKVSCSVLDLRAQRTASSAYCRNPSGREAGLKALRRLLEVAIGMKLHRLRNLAYEVDV